MLEQLFHYRGAVLTVSKSYLEDPRKGNPHVKRRRRNTS